MAMKPLLDVNPILTFTINIDKRLPNAVCDLMNGVKHISLIEDAPSFSLSRRLDD